MANFDVTAQNDDGTGLVAGTLSKAILDANTTAGDDTITLSTDVNITGVMKRLIDSNIAINGSGHTVSGDADGDNDGDFRPFFIKSGTVTFSNLAIADGLAKGGDSRFGGGGAGMGGGLFVYDGNVTLSDVTFTDNVAQGGSPNVALSSRNTGGRVRLPIGAGGGGMYGAGFDYGGGGLFANSTGTNGAYGNNGNYGGGRGSFGGGGDENDNGGFGGGGGAGFLPAGNGGFGGGGGQGAGPILGNGGEYGGDGGYGGGGGQANVGSTGGFGGGNGGSNFSSTGGGGAGMGGAIFIRSGSLIVLNSSFDNNSATRGTGHNNGKGLGGALFALKSTTNTNGNNQGMPDTLPTVTLANVTFSGNNADDNSDAAAVPASFDSGPDLDTEDIWGSTVRRFVPGFTLSKNTAAVSEAGTTALFSIALAAQPISDVVFNLTSSDPDEVTTSATSLTFTSANWNVAQTLTLTGVDDADLDGDQTSIITVSVDDSNSDDSFDDLADQAVTVTTTDDDIDPGGSLTPQADAVTLEVTSLGTSNTLSFDIDQLDLGGVSELLIFSTEGTRTQIGSFSLLQNGKLPDSYSPTFSLDSSAVSDSQLLQFELVENGTTRVATLSRISSDQSLLNFGDGTALTVTLATPTATTNLLVGDADAIDLTGQTGALTVNFSVYRDASSNNTVSLYTIDFADGGIVTDPIAGTVLRPGDVGYEDAALTRQLDISLTGQNGQLSTFSADIMGGGYLGTFLSVNSSVPTADEIYFSHAGANPSGNDHVKLLGNNTFGFEDLAGLGDADFNDVVVQFAIA